MRKIGKVQLFLVEHCLVSDQLEVGRPVRDGSV